MDAERTFEMAAESLLPVYSPELLIERGNGSRVWTADGKEFLDFATGIGVCSLGHCHPAVVDAIAKQAAELAHVSNLYLTRPQVELASRLVEETGFPSRVFFSNSGAEANEAMIKLARKYGSESGRHEIVAMENSFHGRTLATLAATGRSKYREGFGPDMPGFVHARFNDIDDVRSKISDKTCAILVEPIQGEGGVISAEKCFMEGLDEIRRESGALLLFDEVQCGMCRTGAFFAWKRFGVEPDAFSLAKALANGMPIGAMIASERLSGVLGVGAHASTFGGNPVSCAAAVAVVDTMRGENIARSALEMGRDIFERLIAMAERFDMIRGIRGMGLMIGVELDRKADGLKRAIQRRGVLALTAGENVLRLMPPLNISREDANAALTAIELAFAEIQEEK
jgi:predicted acetylornithine/succinylornithine family transaminase